jgi:hypothetical protein
MNYKKMMMILVSSVMTLTLFTACGSKEKDISTKQTSSTKKEVFEFTRFAAVE